MQILVLLAESGELNNIRYGTLVAIAGLIVAVIGLYLQHRKDRSDIELSKKGLEVPSKLFESYDKDQA